MQKTSNPMINRDFAFDEDMTSIEPMTKSGVVNKTSLLLLITVLSAYGVWDLLARGFSDKAYMLMIVGLVAGFILCIFTVIKPKYSPITSPVYAICEGLAVGAISFSYGAMFEGIVQNAVGITFVTLFAMLFLYKTGLIVATENFKRVVFTATLGIAIFYLISLVLSLFGHPLMIFNGGLIGIGISLFICVIAALNFITDFDSIDNLASYGAPKYFEWYCGFSLLVTLIWLYLEVLRLLAQLNSRR